MCKKNNTRTRIHRHQSLSAVSWHAAIILCKAAVQCFNSVLPQGSRETANYSVIIIIIGLTLSDLAITSHSLGGFVRALSGQSYPYNY